ncbi:MAG: hypothetical protein BRD30_02160, partial [Bacteroidetes bacterium QH_2_63_10]
RPITVNASGEVTVASGGGGETYLASAGETPPLPVEFAGFGAVRSGSSVELTWQAASETNNAGFRVQHQVPDSGDWTELGFVESQAQDGTTNDATSYDYVVDTELESGTHRFRLEQVDLDGTTSLSGVETVEVQLDEALTLDAPAPNPVSNQATVSFAVKDASQTTLALYNALGQRMATLYDGAPSNGEEQTVTVEAADLPSGVYFVRLQADGQTRTERLTVVR